MSIFCCKDYEAFCDLGFVWYSKDDEVWYIGTSEVHEIYCCPFCGKKLKHEAVEGPEGESE